MVPSFLINCSSTAQRNVVAPSPVDKWTSVATAETGAREGGRREEKKGMLVQKGLLIGVTTTGETLPPVVGS